MVEYFRQTVPKRWASVRKRPFTRCFCVYLKGDKCTGVTVWLDCEAEGDETDMLGIIIFLLLLLLLSFLFCFVFVLFFVCLVFVFCCCFFS